MNEAVRLENASLVAGEGLRTVHDANLTVSDGEHVLIKGAEGSGKRALMRLIAGMGVPADGKVFVLGRSLHGMNPREAADFRNRFVGICLREPALLPVLTLWENVALPLALRGENAARRKQAALDLLEVLEIGYAAHALPASLSPWEAALAALARAMVSKPPLLLLEEPAADLNNKQAERFFALLEGFQAFAGATALVFASRELLLRFDRRFTMEYGVIREENP